MTGGQERIRAAGRFGVTARFSARHGYRLDLPADVRNTAGGPNAEAGLPVPRDGGQPGTVA